MEFKKDDVVGMAIEATKIGAICIEYCIKEKKRDPSIDLPNLDTLLVAYAMVNCGANSATTDIGTKEYLDELAENLIERTMENEAE